jgi:hypothetical protein
MSTNEYDILSEPPTYSTVQYIIHTQLDLASSEHNFGKVKDSTNIGISTIDGYFIFHVVIIRIQVPHVIRKLIFSHIIRKHFFPLT